MQPNAQKPVDVLSETAEQRVFDRQICEGSPGVCSRDIRQSLALPSAKLTRRVLDNS